MSNQIICIIIPLIISALSHVFSNHQKTNPMRDMCQEAVLRRQKYCWARREKSSNYYILYTHISAIRKPVAIYAAISTSRRAAAPKLDAAKMPNYGAKFIIISSRQQQQPRLHRCVHIYFQTTVKAFEKKQNEIAQIIWLIAVLKKKTQYLPCFLVGCHKRKTIIYWLNILVYMPPITTTKTLNRFDNCPIAQIIGARTKKDKA